MTDSSTITLTIDSLAAGGDGVGRIDGMVAFVPRSAPGDQVRVRLSQRKGFARGEIVEILEPSPMRVDPPCVHYTRDRCGGCQLQHVRYDAQLEAKSSIIRDGLTRIGRRDAARPTVHASASEWRYRTKLTLALRRRNGQWIAGLHPYNDPVAVFPLGDCPITDERVVATWHELLAAADFLPATSALRGSVRVMDGAHATMGAVIEGGDVWRSSEVFFSRVPSLAGLWWKPENRPRQLIASRAGSHAAERAGASFTQVNRGVADDLRAHVIARVQSHRPASVIDGYAGTGDVAAVLSEMSRVTAIEVDRDASARCRERLNAPSVSLAGKVEDLLADALPADVVLLNPPRTGLDERITRLLQDTDSPPRAIVYVSCNPATLGRDLTRMPRYDIVSVEGFDMFPQTAHVETVCELIPSGAARSA